ncbi:hypothetical protein NE865_14516 [Phthorimaea operculella]|nr:hypothetical protein NE865_14516 [Phthorimaea operculella]
MTYYSKEHFVLSDFDLPNQEPAGGPAHNEAARPRPSHDEAARPRPSHNEAARPRPLHDETARRGPSPYEAVRRGPLPGEPTQRSPSNARRRSSSTSIQPDHVEITTEAVIESAPRNDDTNTTIADTDVDLDASLLSLLGEAPEPETMLGKAVHKDVASRWVEIIKKGLTKDVKETLAKEYLIPNNCELLVPPILNPEAKAALSEISIKRDASLVYRQKQISNAMAALARAVDSIIASKCDQELKQKILKPVNDACRILCDMHHNETRIRKKFVVSSVNTGMKETLVNSGTDKYLFGDNMSEKLKAAKNVQRSGETLKAPQKAVFQKSNFYYKNKPTNRPNFKPQQQKPAAKQDAPRAGPASRYQSNNSGSYSRAPDRARNRSPPPPAYRRNARR